MQQENDKKKERDIYINVEEITPYRYDRNHRKKIVRCLDKVICYQTRIIFVY
jgi:CRISPR/Cas system-associated exonuclease Cas4 (RecB family)